MQEVDTVQDMFAALQQLERAAPVPSKRMHEMEAYKPYFQYYSNTSTPSATTKILEHSCRCAARDLVLLCSAGGVCSTGAVSWLMPRRWMQAYVHNQVWEIHGQPMQPYLPPYDEL